MASVFLELREFPDVGMRLLDSYTEFLSHQVKGTQEFLTGQLRNWTVNGRPE